MGVVVIGTLVRDAAAYQAAFEKERAQSYPMVDAFEARMRYALDRQKLEEAARVLACPLKANPPNWQHGRVIYAVTRAYLEGQPGPVHLLDIGTAKGFSALCLQWALTDSGLAGDVVSVDVIDPEARVERNTVAECDGLKTLAEILEPWPEARAITFVKATGQSWLTTHTPRVHVAFVDGKHTYDAVSWEGALLATRQQAGDRVIFDDVHIPGIAEAMAELKSYAFDTLAILPHRKYAIGRRR